MKRIFHFYILSFCFFKLDEANVGFATIGKGSFGHLVRRVLKNVARVGPDAEALEQLRRALGQIQVDDNIDGVQAAGDAFANKDVRLVRVTFHHLLGVLQDKLFLNEGAFVQMK
jgi:hypothetical protein